MNASRDLETIWYKYVNNLCLNYAMIIMMPWLHLHGNKSKQYNRIVVSWQLVHDEHCS